MRIIPRFTLLAALVLALSLLLSSLVLAQPYGPDKIDYLQNSAVQGHFPVPEMKFNTPGFAPGREGFTTHEEMMAFIYDLQHRSSRMSVKIIGYSQEGRPMPLLIFSKPAYGNAADILRLGKPVIWLQGQQHGDEPAGGESMLVIAEKLALGTLGEEVLDKIAVLVIPRCNPDGSYYFSRRTATTIDVNRDHIKLELPETRALHSAFSQFRPDLAVDAHEYSVGRDFRDVTTHEMLKYHDMLLLSATNPNVPEKVTRLADDLFLKNAEKSLDANGFTHHWYYTVSGKGVDKTIDMGGSDAIIGRNALGLQPTVSFLVESRGIGIGRQDFARRVAAQVVTQTSILQTAAGHASELKRTIEVARQELAAKGLIVDESDKVVVRSTPRLIEKYTLPLIDAVTGEVVQLPVKVRDAKQPSTVLERVRPYAYIMPPAYDAAARILAKSGVTVRKLAEPATLLVESYKIVDKKVNTAYFEGHFRNDVKTEVQVKQMEFPAGSYVYYMNQPAGNVIAMTLEPEADSSLVRFNHLPVDIGDIVPVYRYMESNRLHTYIPSEW